MRRLVTQHGPGYALLIPCYAFFALFTLWPLVQNVLVSLQSVSPVSSKFIGVDNYIRMFQDPVFWTALRNTLVLTFFLVPAITVTALLISVVAVRLGRQAQSAIRAAFYLPVVASAVVLSLVWLWILNPVYGLLNYLLGLVGIAPVEWLGQTGSALGSIGLVLYSLSLGTPVILYIAGLNAIPEELYDASSVDGANALQTFWHVTLPSLRPTTAFVVVTSTIATYQVFTVVQIMTRGGPANATQTMVYRIYEKGFLTFDFGQSAALTVALLAVAGITSILQMKVVGRSND